MSTPRHHAEWLTLIEQSGPFLSLPVLLRVFPQGLDTVESETRRRLGQAYEEWRESQLGPRPDPVLHREWIAWVLGEVLGLPGDCLVRDQGLPAELRLVKSEEGETLRPDLALVQPRPVDLLAALAPEPVAPDAERRTRLLINLYPASQWLDRAVPGRRWKASPGTRMADLLRALDVPVGLVTNGEDWLLVHAPREAAASTATWQARLWIEEPLTLRSLVSLLGVRRFFGVPPGDTLPALFAESAENQQAITDQLGLQVRHALEILIQSLDRLDKERGRHLLTGVTPERLYEAGLTVMMRLVFLLFAEERQLLPLNNPVYNQHYAVSTLGAQLRETADQFGEEILERRHDAWNRLLALFRLIYAGSEYQDLRLPAYGGKLFNPDRFPFLEGRPPHSDWRTAAADPLPIHNRTLLHLLEALQYLRIATPGGGPAQARRLSFNALGVENIGTVYEGLLDHTAKRTPQAVLGLTATQGASAEVPLAELEKLAARGTATLVEHLKALTKRSPAALERALTTPDPLDEARLRSACDNDEALLARVRPFAGLLRADSLGYPVVITSGSVFVTAGQDRRSTGTHYTPPELTEPLVRHALDPLVYAGMAEGTPPSPETLRGPAEILALKVCDLACGSGAFLVQACRYLAAKLVEAWGAVGAGSPALSHPHSQSAGKPAPTPSEEGSGDTPTAIDAELAPFATDPEERLIAARRLVADRCLYGVDKNPLAVEMAKLSLWLVTLQRDKPFTFLDHAIRAGDSLLGIARLDELEAFYIDGSGQQRLSAHADHLRDAAKKRAELAAIPDIGLDEIEIKALLLADAEEDVRQTRLLADLVTGAQLAAARNKRRSAHDLLQSAALLDFGRMEQEAAEWLGAQRAFHWPLGFPEVFLRGGWDNERASLTPAPLPKGDGKQGGEPIDWGEGKRGGFDAFIGNPPFMGGQKITGNLGTAYRDYLVAHLAGGKRGSADLCAYFFLRAASLLRPGGMAGLLATNTLAQGDTREVGLDQLAARGIAIPRAVPSRKWPGAANLEVAHVWLHKGDWRGPWVLDDRPVPGITPYLTAPGAVSGPPKRLKANADKSFQGSIVLGMGFVLDPAEAQALLAQEPRHRDCLFPYLNGEDLNSRPDQSPSRWVINFHDWPLERSASGSWDKADENRRKGWLRGGRVPEDYPGKVAADYPALLAIVEEKVKPERMRNNRKVYRDRWWWYAERRPKLYATIEGMERVLVAVQTSKFLSISFHPARTVYSHMTVVFALDDYTSFSVLNASWHTDWVLEYCSQLETRLRYLPTDGFETFPFPASLAGLHTIGERYYRHRQSIMQTRQEGLTKTYNRFHDPAEQAPDIAALRALHVALDQAVAAAYGWTDLLPSGRGHPARDGRAGRPHSPGAGGEDTCDPMSHGRDIRNLPSPPSIGSPPCFPSPSGRGQGEGLGHGFHQTKQGLRYTLSEPARREILDRLLALNFERYEQEVAAGFHGKGATGPTATLPKAGRHRPKQALGVQKSLF